MKQMPIPTSIKLGKQHYDVYTFGVMHYTAAKGYIDYRKQHIYLGQRCNVTGRTYSPKEQAETFWHEVTHGILHSMNHPLYTNEKFVTEFAKRLNNAIHSAKF